MGCSIRKLKDKESSNNSGQCSNWALSLAIAEGIIFSAAFVEINAESVLELVVLTLIIISILFLAKALTRRAE